MGFLFPSEDTARRDSDDATFTIFAADLEAQADLATCEKTIPSKIGLRIIIQCILWIFLFCTPLVLYCLGVGYMIDIARFLRVPMSSDLYMSIITIPWAFMFIVSVVQELVGYLTFKNSIRDLSEFEKSEKRQLRRLEAEKAHSWRLIKNFWTSLFVLICVASFSLFVSHVRDTETHAQTMMNFNAKIDGPNALQNITSCIERNIPERNATLFDFIGCWKELDLDIASTERPFELTSPDRS